MVEKIAIQSLLEPTADLISIKAFHLVVKLRDSGLSTAEKGHQLLSAERHLRQEIDPRIEVFLEPMGDSSALRRRLRGVQLD